MHLILASTIGCLVLCVATGCSWLPTPLFRSAHAGANARPVGAARTASRPSATFYYIVERGDTLSKLAPRLGTSVAALVHENRLSDPDRLEVGQRLAVPADATWTIPKPRKRAAEAVVQRAAATSPVPWRLAEPAQLADDVPAPLLAVDCALIDADQRLRSAHFEEALDQAREARSLLGPLQSEPGAVERGVHADVLVAMAEVALGNDTAAGESFARALVADPGLTLEPDEVSPKILRLFEETRRQVELRQASR